MAAARSFRSVLEDVFGDLGAGATNAPEQRLASSTGTEGAADVSEEDAEIALLMAQLTEDEFRMDQVSTQLREERLDAEALRSQLLLPADGLCEAAASRAAEATPAAAAAAPELSQAAREVAALSVPGELLDSDSESEDAQAVETSHAWERASLERLMPFSYSASKLPADSLKVRHLEGYSTGKLAASSLKGKQLEGRALSLSKIPAVPLQVSPDAVPFEGCRVGGSYEAKVELKNLSKTAMNLRILPCTNRAFTSEPLRYDKETRKKIGTKAGLLPPGMTAYLKVRFEPKDLDDQADQLVIGTDLGNISLPICASGVLPPSLG